MKTALRRLAVSLCVAGGVAFVQVDAQVPGDAPRPRFRSSLDVVTIQASVRDTRGRTVTGLRPDDFEVRDNGELRQVLSLRSDRQSPVSLAILVDVSGSMRLAGSRDMARLAFESILGQLQDRRDEVALFSFDSALQSRHGFTTNLASLRGALNEFESFGTTALYDAAAAAARRVAARSAAHKGVVILTDGIDTSSRLTAEEVSGLASSIDVPVYVVATVASTDDRLAMERSRRSPHSNTADLRDLAEWTGGELVFASSLGEAAYEVSQLISDLRQQYVIAIEAANSHEWRRLDVRVKRRSAMVKARSGYYGG